MRAAMIRRRVGPIGQVAVVRRGRVVARGRISPAVQQSTSPVGPTVNEIIQPEFRAIATSKYMSNPYEYSDSLNPDYKIPEIEQIPSELSGLDEVKEHIKANKWWYIGGGVALLAALGGLGYYIYTKKKKSKEMQIPPAP